MRDMRATIATPQDLIALDRAPSARTITADGHMRVTGSAVSKSNVCVYRGDEIPGYEALGLDARKTYRLYRDPAELEKAAATLNGKPLLVLHRPVTAGDHAPELVAGALDNARWDAPYLRADLTIWSQDAIDLVESGEQRELSCAYRYKPVLRSGTSPAGEAFDAVMTAIDFNHCCLVADGRAGSDVHVGDQAMPEQPKGKAAMSETIDPDADADTSQTDPLSKVMHFLMGKLSADDMKAVKDLLSPDEEEAEDDMPEAKQGGALAKEKQAMDENLLIRRWNAIRTAERECRPYIGELETVPNSASEIYRLALDSNNVDLRDIPTAAYRGMMRMLPGALAAQRSSARQSARSDAARESFNARFPNAGRLINR